MARICVNCGKKIGPFANDPIAFEGESYLCYECAEPIKSKINSLYSIEDIDLFVALENEILKYAQEKYTEKAIAGVREKITQIYNGSYTLQNMIKARRIKTLVKNYMVTTGYNFQGYTIKKYLGVISGQVVLGTGFLTEITASFADFFGEESNRFANKLEDAKNAAIEKLILKSEEQGGNALIGVDFDYISFQANMIGVVANGTSVFVEKETG